MSDDPSSPASPLRLEKPVAAPLLTYATEPTVRITGRHVRWGVVWLGAFLVFTGFVLNPLFELSPSLGIGAYGTPAAPINSAGSDRDTRAIYGAEVAGDAGLFLLTQALFLLPRGRMAFRTTDSGRPMARAAVGAAFAGMLLTVGLAAAVLEWHGDWLPLTASGSAQHVWPVWLAMLLLWALWAAVFHHLWRNLDHRTAVSRTTRALLAGSVLELLVASPVHAWVVRKGGDDDCYCARGSYTALVFGGTVLFWLFGPGVLLLAMRERKRVAPRA